MVSEPDLHNLARLLLSAKLSAIKSLDGATTAAAPTNV
jgi:hypothetical protein